MLKAICITVLSTLKDLKRCWLTQWTLLSSATFNNKPIILRDKYNVKGSDVAQIGWVEVTTEAGTSGYLWYLKSEHESRLRFEDYLEMSNG